MTSSPSSKVPFDKRFRRILGRLVLGRLTNVLTALHFMSTGLKKARVLSSEKYSLLFKRK